MFSIELQDLEMETSLISVLNGIVFLTRLRASAAGSETLWKTCGLGEPVGPQGGDSILFG